MIDILYSYNQNGPGKVISNLKKGLDLLGVSYRENPSDITSESKAVALQWHENITKYEYKNILIGPNVCTLPIDNDFVMMQRYHKVIVPSEWVETLYSKWIPKDKIFIWPVGIDTEYFSDKSKVEKEFDCLIYYKRRSIQDLIYVTKLLKSYNQNFDTIEYGKYNENSFIDKASKSKYVFLLDGCESQGIAVQEIMSMNIPIFSWDVTHWDDRGVQFKTEASSIPYWDKRCGMFETDRDNVEKTFGVFLEKFGFFHPRDYILENLTLEICAKKIIDVINF
jgi:hypothetical protein